MTEILNQMVNMIWSLPLILIILLTGFYYSVIMGFPQIRLFKETLRLMKERGESELGLSPFQSFIFTAARTVGVGNIAGMAAGIYFGGPGAIFWLWVLALFGSSIAILEGTLAQTYKEVINNEYKSGPSHYMAQAFRNQKVGRVFALVYAVITTISLSLLMPGVQSFYIVQGLHNALNIPSLFLALALTLILGLVIFGGLKRIGRTSQRISPIAGLLYVIISLIVIVVKIDQLPATLVLIFQSALGRDAVFGAMIGSALQWGMRRGAFANEIGMGTSAITSATSKVNHPAQQGLLGGLSVYIGTLFICTTTTFMILMTGSYNVVNSQKEIVFEGVKGMKYGTAFVANAIQSVIPIPNFGNLFIAFAILIFAFVALTAFYLYAESSLAYLIGDKPLAFILLKLVFLATVFAGTLVVSDTIWTLADIGNGLMVWINVVALIFIGRQGASILKDYTNQQAKGIQDPHFDPSSIGIDHGAEFWRR
ncbi:sodium:alanine symporter family protein [Facklamia sp. 7083-14-GEN3]|uniref:alanine/glycine:cation symporter family protein n=1 Tax=Facklamia sp. 7083-14-GEN3 TaxID=2973478 RepID=UPI00215C4EF7|nr:alanine/glycine:cation symporter family protein [Facklamia sp. 7083-14-GEN3]MCR8968926.1 alanine:cation symporter family protein [Facklamia sp. 7083-14-GEN3]